jgi:uncharacterized protein YbaP (TraB family)
MKKYLLFIFLVIISVFSHSQIRPDSKKYPSLFWEITGKGASKPSYLFGTMHVSSKMVFHLPDSFYLGLKHVDVVALETNPESWQDDLVKYEMDNSSYSSFAWQNFKQMPDDYLNIGTLRFDKYEKLIESALYSRPATINNLLYRSNSDASSDFEENTYLDMYIYQVGKKMGKRVTGVEKYDESMKLMMEAYRDAAKDKNRKERSYDSDDTYSPDNLQDAYRTGNLDRLDSINRLNSFSEAFDEKFLYKRNELQANAIDSIIRSHASLFVGVGAAHLPGNRGVIELLRKKGYTVRPIIMGERDSRNKELVEKMRVPVTFATQEADDKFFTVDIPGKFYRIGDPGAIDQLQHADMANGSYYLVTRIKTNSSLWGHSDETVRKKIDSVLYENIPGRILNRLEINRSGYKGLDITNRTRRGDVQRYQIYVTPFEVIIFKMSGNGDYVKEGDEANRFFGSIKFRETSTATEWKIFQPSAGGFSVKFPSQPFVFKTDNWEYTSQDKTTGMDYTVLRTDIHNYNFAEEDSFDLGLLDESLSSSGFISKELSRKQTVWKGYPALDAKYLNKDGSLLFARFLIQGPHYYTLIAHGKKEEKNMQEFFNSFEITPFVYHQPAEYHDSSLLYTVRTAYYPESKKIKLSVPGSDGGSLYTASDDDGDDSNDHDPFGSGIYRSNLISNDSTGEKIFVSVFKTGRYFFLPDSTGFEKGRTMGMDSTWIIRSQKKSLLPGDAKVWEYILSDTNSSRIVHTKTVYKNGAAYFLLSEGDTLSAPSAFVTSFFDSFAPSDSLEGYNPFQKKTAAFLKDFFSADTAAHKRTLHYADQLKPDSADLLSMQKLINSVNWNDRKYLETKKTFIASLANIKTNSCSDFLKTVYYAAGDTLELQYAALETLLRQTTLYSFSVFQSIIAAEPPVLTIGNNSYNSWESRVLSRYRVRSNSESNGSFLDELNDSLQLTHSILPGLLPLLDIEDYKPVIMSLLGKMVDSSLITANEYDLYYNRFYNEAKLELKKQVIREKNKAIEKASSSAIKKDEGNDPGNDELSLYAKLLLPFWNTHTAVQTLFVQLLRCEDMALRFETVKLLLRHGRDIPDSTILFFAANDEYRYAMYNVLASAGKLNRFPSLYNDHLDLAKSKLIDLKSYSKPDSIAYVDRVPLSYKGRDGFIYFFRYREKKDDPSWKLATVGLVPGDPHSFPTDSKTGEGSTQKNIYDFTSFTDTRISFDEPAILQLNRLLKKMIYSKRKSARQFYNSKADVSE